MKILVFFSACFVLIPHARSNLLQCVPLGTYDKNKDYFPEKVSATKSLLWDIKYFKTYKILRNEIAGETFVLYQCGAPRPLVEDNKGHTHFIPVPLRNGIALSSTTIIPYFELLGLRTSIKGWLGDSSYISSACLKKLISSGATTVVKDTSKPANVNALKTKYGTNIVSFHNYRTAYQSSLLNVTDSSYLEATNEAIFEWIKFFAVFYNREEKVNEIFKNYTARYQCFAEEAQDLVDQNNGGKKPTLIWASYTNYNNADGWAVAQCPNYYCEYANKCSASLISSNGGTIDYYGTKLFTTSAFVALAQSAQYWIYSSNNWEEAYAKYKTQLDTMVSVKNKKVFDTTGSGENAWFENRLAEFDLVLQDICSVVGTANPAHKRKFMRNVFREGPGVPPTSCRSVSAPLVSRATACRKVVVPPSGCFSGDTVVHLQGGQAIHMKDLRIGDVVDGGQGKFTTVYSFGHYDTEVETHYLQLHTNLTSERPIEVTADHMLYVGGQALPAGSLKVGDILQLSNGDSAQVEQVKSVTRTGAYAPFTESGWIVVNSIVASNYISLESNSGYLTIGGMGVISYQWVAHLTLAPHRFYCALSSSNCKNDSCDAKGISLWVAAPFEGARWWLEQHVALQMVTLAPVLVLLFGIYAVEMLLRFPSMMLVFVVTFGIYKRLLMSKTGP